MQPRREARLLVAIGLGLLAFVFVTASVNSGPTDLDQIHKAARWLASGRSPYVPEFLGTYWFPFYYPLTAPLLLWPTRELPLLLVRALFMGASTAVFAFAITRHDWRRLPMFLSGAYFAIMTYVQWTPLLASVLAYPALGFVLAAKPNLGLAVMAALHTRRDFLIAGLSALTLTAVSGALWPGWFSDWLATIATADANTALITLPGGFILLLAALGWRQGEARLILALSIIPQNHGLTHALLLLLIPRSLRGVLVLALASWIVYWLAIYVAPATSPATFPAYGRAIGIVTLWTMYVPALVIHWRDHERRRNQGNIAVVELPL